MRMARCQDGESFAIMAQNPNLRSNVTLDIQLIEADRVTDDEMRADGASVDGITFDRFGNPKSYKVLKKHPQELLGKIREWMASDRSYTIRFGIGMLQRHFLDDRFCPDYLTWVAAVDREEYYVRMMVAWYFATALAKQYSATILFLEQGCLPVWTHNKTIQKARESYRVLPEHKIYLQTLKR